MKKTLAIVLSGAMACTAALTSMALENPAETVWGTMPASAYMMLQFHNGERSIDIPKKYFEGMAGGMSKENAKSMYYEAVHQSPYLFYTSGLRIYDDEEDSIRVERICSLQSPVEQSYMIAAEAEADRVLPTLVNSYMSDYEKMVSIYNYCCKVASYDWTAYEAIVADNFMDRQAEWIVPSSSYGCLVEGYAVCSGYAQAFNLLARKAGLTSLSVTGTDYNVNHIWNRCWANGKWYEIDACNKIFTDTVEEYERLSGMTLGGDALSSKGSDYMGF